MKKIVLKYLQLTNYRNIEFAKFEFDGNSKIVGENRIGKTNTLEAIYWLLTDKLLDGSSSIAAIKPISDTKKKVSVKGEFEVDGKSITLEKVYAENWVKTRGSTELVMSGHYEDLFYNGVKQPTQKSYLELVYQDFGLKNLSGKIDVMQLLINPFYLGNMGETDDWKNFRSFIIDLVGDVKDADVFAAYPNFLPIKENLDFCNGRIDQVKKQITGTIDSLKEQIAGFDSQIKLLEETPNPTDEEFAFAKKGIEEHEINIHTLKVHGEDAVSSELTKKIASKELELANLKEEDLRAKISSTQNQNEKISLLRMKQDNLFNDKTFHQNKISNYNSGIAHKEAEKDSFNKIRNDLLTEIKEIDENLKNINVATCCPVCNRPYEEAQIESERKSIESKLKARREEIITKGVSNKDKLVKIETEIDNYKTLIVEEERLIDGFNQELEMVSNELTTALEELDNARAGYTSNPKIAAVEEEIANLKKELEEARSSYDKARMKVNSLIYEEEKAQEPFKKVLADRDHWIRNQHSLSFVNQNKIIAQGKLADNEQKLELLAKFNYCKLKMLDENVSKVFGNIKFQLIKENINGGFDTICKPYIYDSVSDSSSNVSWKSGSKSERVVTGIAIAECVKKQLDLPDMPYLFDEGGEISTDTFKTRFKTNSQLICVKIVDNIMNPLVQSF